MTDDIHPRLQKHAADYAAETLKAITSPLDLLFPGSSKIVDFFIDQALPRREERFAQFMTDLSRRLHALEERFGEGVFGAWDAEKQALFEEGARLAVKATSQGRIDQLAKIVSEGLTEDEVRAAKSRHLLDLVGQLTDLDVIVLTSHTRRGWDDDWRAANAAALGMRAPRPAKDATTEERIRDDVARREQSVDRAVQSRRLAALGLIFRPEQHYIDQSRTLSGPGVVRTQTEREKLTDLGEAVLIKLGVIEGRLPWIRDI